MPYRARNVPYVALYSPYWSVSMISGIQIRASRAALRWTIDELAQHSGLGVRTIKRFESQDGIPASRSSTLVGLKATLESAGIEFIGTPEDSPGIRVRFQGSDKKPRLAVDPGEDRET